jgi:hypothetical protein
MSLTPMLISINSDISSKIIKWAKCVKCVKWAKCVKCVKCVKRNEEMKK